MFEALTLGVFQVGLSWRIVFDKRDAFGRAFKGFDVASIIRNRKKHREAGSVS